MQYVTDNKDSGESLSHFWKLLPGPFCKIGILNFEPRDEILW